MVGVWSFHYKVVSLQVVLLRSEVDSLQRCKVVSLS